VSLFLYEFVDYLSNFPNGCLKKP